MVSKKIDWDGCPHRLEMGINMAKVQEKLDNVDKKVDELTSTVKEFIKSARNEFANKGEVNRLKVKVDKAAGYLIVTAFTIIGTLFKLLLFP